MAILDGYLSETKTHKVRWYRAVFPALDFLARVQIKQGLKLNGKWKDDESYFLDWLPDSELRPGYKGFLFTNCLREPTEERTSLYRVIVRESTLEVLSCSCKGAVCWRQTLAPCKHRDVIAALIERDVFTAADIEDVEGVLVLF